MSKVNNNKVSFSWEYKPGVSNLIFMPQKDQEATTKLNLPPPPSAFRAPSGTSSKKGSQDDDDPFFAAYKECTKTPYYNDNEVHKSQHVGNKKGILNFSCKQSCSVVDHI
ncbi:hypothetical protein ACFE04_004547 [Oxalis oulophora]